jgi:hypothetical protein
LADCLSGSGRANNMGWIGGAVLAEEVVERLAIFSAKLIKN